MGYDLSQIDLLVVEHDVGMAATWRRLLDGLGIRNLRLASSLERAWAALSAPGGKADVLICRWEMPAGDDGMADGLDLVQRLRCDPASSVPFLPAIIVTATITRERVRKALDAGVNELLVLPLSGKALETRLREIVERPRPFVRGGGYFGPDRRRFSRPDYPGPFRRSDDRRKR